MLLGGWRDHRHTLIRPVRRFEQLEQFDRLITRITQQLEENATAQDIADRLNAEGWRPPKKAVFDVACCSAAGSARDDPSGLETFPGPATMK